MPVTGLWTAPDAPRPLDSALTEEQPRLADWLAMQGPEERRQLWGRLDSQLLLGERVQVHDIEDGWARVTALRQPSARDAAGYPGFVPAHHLVAVSDHLTGSRVVVHRPLTTLTTGDASTAEVSFATVLTEITRTPSDVAVRVPGGGTGWLPIDDVATLSSGEGLPSAADLLGAARQFLGVGYVAAGLHARSYDCSGLVHAVYRRFGVTVPRDARDQVAVGQEVPIDDAQPGDLMFFTHRDTGVVYHVGLCAEPPAMLHASQSEWAVLEDRLEGRRRQDLSHVRRLRADPHS